MARASTVRSRARCQAPLAPGRLSAAGESSRTACGSSGGRWSSAAVTVEKIAARARRPRPARRAASASTRSVTATWRRSLPASAPTRTGTSSHERPCALISSARASSARRSPGVVPRDTRAMSRVSATRGRLTCGRVSAAGRHRRAPDARPRGLPIRHARLACGPGSRRAIRGDRGGRRLERRDARGGRTRGGALDPQRAPAGAELGAQRGHPRRCIGPDRAGGRRRGGTTRLAARAGGGRPSPPRGRCLRWPHPRPPRGPGTALLRP